MARSLRRVPSTSSPSGRSALGTSGHRLWPPFKTWFQDCSRRSFPDRSGACACWWSLLRHPVASSARTPIVRGGSSQPPWRMLDEAGPERKRCLTNSNRPQRFPNELGLSRSRPAASQGFTSEKQALVQTSMASGCCQNRTFKAWQGSAAAGQWRPEGHAPSAHGRSRHTPRTEPARFHTLHRSALVSHTAAPAHPPPSLPRRTR